MFWEGLNYIIVTLLDSLGEYKSFAEHLVTCLKWKNKISFNFSVYIAHL